MNINRIKRTINKTKCDDPGSWGEDPDGGGYDDVPGTEQGSIPDPADPDNN